MKKQLLLKGVLFSAIVIFTFACKKENNIEKVEPVNPEESKGLTSAIVGKWTIASETNVSSKKQDQDKILFIEFFKDSTYIVSMSGGTTLTGKYGVTDTTEINIAELGTLSDIRIEDKILNFKFSTQGGSILITANKAPEIPASEETTKICRTWKLVGENFSPVTFGWNGEYDTHLRFSTSGTYLLTVRNLQDSVAAIRTTDWKWHPDLPNTFQYTGYNYTIDQTLTNSAEIIELTSNSLVIKDWFYIYQIVGDKREIVLTSQIQTFVPVE